MEDDVKSEDQDSTQWHKASDSGQRSHKSQQES